METIITNPRQYVSDMINASNPAEDGHLFGEELIVSVEEALRLEGEASGFDITGDEWQEWAEDVIVELKKFQVKVADHPATGDFAELGVYWNYDGYSIEGDLEGDTDHGTANLFFDYDNGGERFNTVAEAVSANPFPED